MIDRAAFSPVWQRLCKRWGRVVDPDEAVLYWRWLSLRMDGEEFARAAEHLWATREFFPTPADFVAVGAKDDWPLVLSVLEGGPDAVDAYERMGERAREALRLCGGSEGLQRVGAVRARRAFADAVTELVGGADTAEAREQAPVLSLPRGRGLSRAAAPARLGPGAPRAPTS